MTDIERRLRDLADSAGPWADPLPVVRRRTRLRRIPPQTLAVAAVVVVLLVGTVAGALSLRGSSGGSNKGSRVILGAGGGSLAAPCPTRPTGTARLIATATVRPDGTIRLRVSGLRVTDEGHIDGVLLSGERVVGHLRPIAGAAGVTNGIGGYTGRPVSCIGQPLHGSYRLVVVAGAAVSTPVPVTLH